MSVSRSTPPAPTAVVKNAIAQDSFMSTIRRLLEHVLEAEWLKANSPLETAPLLTSPHVDNVALAANGAAAGPRMGIKTIDDRLSVIWQNWQTRAKNTTQSVLWAAVRQLALADGHYHAALLMLTYFGSPPARANDLMLDLALGRSTYYRHLEAALQALEQALVGYMRPSLRLEMPTPRQLIGRDQVQADCLRALHAGQRIAIVGPSGLGKTALAAALAACWNALSAQRSGNVFWYTIRPRLNDNVQQLMFALAFFLFERGFPHLWSLLIANPDALTPGKALDMIRKGLESLASDPPLLCIDEADLLLPADLEDDTDHERLRSFIEDLAQSGRSGAPLILIGQRMLMEHERGCIFELERLAPDDIRTLIEREGFAPDADTLNVVTRHTRGNPLLLQLLMALHHANATTVGELARLSTPMSLEWFLARLRRHLSDTEQTVLDELCVHEAPAPADIWRKQRNALLRLIQLNLVEEHAEARVTVPVTLRAAMYNRLSALAKESLHLSAARELSRRGIVTPAAHHYILAGHPAMAIWTFYGSIDTEVRQGQAATALRLFEPLQGATFTHEQDRRALALILAHLFKLAGRHEDGLLSLEGVPWPATRETGARARALRGALLAMRGDMDAALAQYRESLDSTDRISAAQRARPAMLRADYARQLLKRVGDRGAARHEAARAQYDVEILLGELEDAEGLTDRARARYDNALAAALTINDPFCLAKAHEALGFLEARVLNIDTAVFHFREAARNHGAYGNLMCQLGMSTSNIAYCYLLGRRYEQALQPAQEAVAYFETTSQPYWQALSEGNLAEILVNLDRVDEADHMLQRAFTREEIGMRAFLLPIMSHIRRKQQRFDDATRYAAEGVSAADEEDDMLTRAYAWLEYAEALRGKGSHDAALAAFAKARELFVQAGMTAEAERVDALLAQPVPA